MTPVPTLGRVIETSLYVDDLERAAAFYEDVLEMPLLARFGVGATCRASFALYNTREEIDVLAQSLVKAQEFFA